MISFEDHPTDKSAPLHWRGMAQTLASGKFPFVEGVDCVARRGSFKLKRVADFGCAKICNLST